MYTWMRQLAVFGAVTLLAACSGEVGAPGAGDGANPSGANPDAMDPTVGGPGGVDPVGPVGGVDPVTGAPVGGVDPVTGAPVGGVDPVTGAPSNPADPATGDPACAQGVTPTSQLQRLTRTQYDNTIQDLLGLGGEPSSMLAPDAPGSVDQRAWDGYQTAAKALAEEVMASDSARAHVIPCAPEGDGAACAQQFVAEFGLRAFRRPLTADETARFETLYDNRAELTATGSFEEGAQLIIEAFLVSPSFLTRAEVSEQADGEYFALNGYEVASRLSYMLWGSMPDDVLFDAAAAGELATEQGILTQAQRMLQDVRARSQVAEFHRHYAHMGPGTRWAEISRDTSVYPAFSDALVPLMSQETERLFEYIVFELGGTFQDLITSPVALVNASTAPLYGLDPEQHGPDLQPVSLDPGTRPGIFTRLGFLASHASFNRTSPILRGAFLQEEVLCTDIPPPPPDVEGTPLPTEGLATNRERVDAQTADGACSGCHHTLINPTGFALEAFDAIGAVQTMDNGVAVNTQATVPIGATPVEVSGPADLMTAIAHSPEAQRCYTKKWAEHAYGRELKPEDACTVDTVASKLTEGGYTVLNLITDLTQSPSFRYRAIETEVAQ